MSLLEIEIHRHSITAPWTYRQLDLRQREIASQLRNQRCHGIILLSELAPVITYGRRTPSHDLVFVESQKEKTDYYPTDRGGLATYHGPGQWVLFPVDLMKNLVGDSRGVKKVIQALLEIALEVGQEYSPRVEIRWGAEMGVWTPKGKFAAVGIAIEEGVLLHGLSFNGFKTSQSFQGLRPCGLDLPVDYLLPEPSEREFLQLGNRLLELTCKKFGKVMSL